MILTPQVNGNEVVYRVSTQHFTDMVAMQYGIEYDANQLTFVGFENYNLPSLDVNDFNANQPGLIRTVWLEPQLMEIDVDNGTVLYEMVFEMQNGTHGGVCFSEDVLLHEFVQASEELVSFTVIDDCHSTPFQILLTVSTEELTELYGVRVEELIQNQQIIIQIDNTLKAEINVFDISGRMILSFEEQQYLSGTHTIQVHPVLLPGMYFLGMRVQDKYSLTKLLATE